MCMASTSHEQSTSHFVAGHGMQQSSSSAGVSGLAVCPELPVAVYSTLAQSAEGSQELVARDSAQAGGDGAVLGLLVCGVCRLWVAEGVLGMHTDLVAPFLNLCPWLTRRFCRTPQYQGRAKMTKPISAYLDLRVGEQLPRLGLMPQ